MGLNRILIIDDEWNLRNLIKVYLNDSSYHVKEAENGLEGLRIIEKEPFDLVILDIMLPELDGWEVCRRIRLLSDVPILMLTARGSVSDRVRGLKIGADDYLPKPFASEELIARIEVLLRRGNLKETKNEAAVIKYGPLQLNPESRICQVNQVDLELTQKEFDLLLLMARHPKKVYTREHLLGVIWENAFERDERIVDTHIKNIREKIKRVSSEWNPIKTVWGVGYKLHDMELT
jgi:two-component system, OmpR family, response regulator ResD